jgi:ribosomal protein S11
MLNIFKSRFFFRITGCLLSKYFLQVNLKFKNFSNLILSNILFYKRLIKLTRDVNLINNYRISLASKFNIKTYLLIFNRLNYFIRFSRLFFLKKLKKLRKLNLMNFKFFKMKFNYRKKIWLKKFFIWKNRFYYYLNNNFMFFNMKKSSNVKRKSKNRKKINLGLNFYLSLIIKKNNVILTFSGTRNNYFNVLFQITSGSCGYKGKKKKSPFVVSTLIDNFLNFLSKIKLRKRSRLILSFRNFFSNAIVKSLLVELKDNNIYIHKIKDQLKIPHGGGVKGKKLRRL